MECEECDDVSSAGGDNTVSTAIVIASGIAGTIQTLFYYTIYILSIIYSYLYNVIDN